MHRRNSRFATVALVVSLLAGCADPGPPPGGRIPELLRIDQRAGTGAVASPART